MSINEKLTAEFKKSETTSNADIAKKFGMSTKSVSAKRTWYRKRNGIAPKGTSASRKITQGVYKDIAVKSPKKQECRNKFVDAVVSSGVTGLVPTLPHIQCKTEKMILATGLSNTFVAKENKRDTFKKLRDVIKQDGLPIKASFGEFNELIYNADPDTYAHMFADYCGGLMTLRREINAIFQNDIVRVGGVVGITLCLRASIREGDTIDQMANTNPRDKRPQSVKGIEAFFNKAIGFKYNISEIFEYNNTSSEGRGQAMVLVLIKRLR